MASNPYVNKVVVNNNTILDLTADTVDASHLSTGYTAHDCSGALITGTGTVYPLGFSWLPLSFNQNAIVGRCYNNTNNPTNPTYMELFTTTYLDEKGVADSNLDYNSISISHPWLNPNAQIVGSAPVLSSSSSTVVLYSTIYYSAITSSVLSAFPEVDYNVNQIVIETNNFWKGMSIPIHIIIINAAGTEVLAHLLIGLAATSIGYVNTTPYMSVDGFRYWIGTADLAGQVLSSYSVGRTYINHV